MLRDGTTLCLKKVPTFKLYVKCSPIFEICALLESVWNLLQNPQNTTHLTLGMLLHYLGKIKNAHFSADIQHIWRKMQTICIFIASTSVIHPQISIFSVFKIASFSPLIANKIFHVTVLLLVYFCDQFVAPGIRHSRRHSSVCQQSTWCSVTRTRYW